MDRKIHHLKVSTTSSPNRSNTIPIKIAAEFLRVCASVCMRRLKIYVKIQTVKSSKENLKEDRNRELKLLKLQGNTFYYRATVKVIDKIE